MNQTLGSNLRAARRAAGLTQAELANRLSMSRTTIMQLESGAGFLAFFNRCTDMLEHNITGRSLPPGAHLGERLARLRQRRDISGRALATLADLSRSTIHSIENGNTGQMVAVEKLGRVLGAGLQLQKLTVISSFWAGAGTSSAHHGWNTPPELLEKLYPLLGGCFDLDPCSSGSGSTVRSRIRFTIADDGLALPWFGSCFVNPTYGRTLLAWMQKAREEAAVGHAAPIIALIPARSDTRWWHEHVAKWADVWMLRGRLKFGAVPANAAPFPSALVGWGISHNLRAGICAAFPEAWHVSSTE